MMRLILTITLIGATGCSVSVDALCTSGLPDDAARLRAGMEAHPETPDAVGEPATDIVLGVEGAC